MSIAAVGCAVVGNSTMLGTGRRRGSGEKEGVLCWEVWYVVEVKRRMTVLYCCSRHCNNYCARML
jgi:hypothetical protein